MHFKSALILFILLVWKCVFSINGFGQNIPHKVFTTEHGLPGNTVYDMLQDSRGYMWFATGSGVSRFDGRHFVNYSIEDGLTDLDILELFQDSKGRVWFLSLNGSACYWLDEKIHNEESDPYLSKVRLRSGIVSMQEDKNGVLWFGGANFSYACIYPDNRVETFRASLPHISFMVDDLGELLLFNENLIFVHTDNGFKKLNEVHIPGDRLAVTQVAQHHEVLILDSTGIVATNSSGLFSLKVPIELLPFQLSRNIINVDISGNIFLLANEGGVYLLRKTVEGYTAPQRLFREYLINKVFRDDEGSLWMSTIGSGVLFVPASTYDIGVESSWNEIENKRISAIECDEKGRLVVGCSDGCVMLVDANGSRIIKEGDLKLGSTVTDFCFFGDQLLWSTGTGAYGFYGDKVIPMLTMPHENDGPLFNGGKRSVFVGPGDRIYSSYYGIYSWTDAYYEIIKSELIPIERINYPMYDSQNNLWYDQGEELNRLSAKGELKSFDHLRKSFRGKITGILELEANTMLISTYGSGLYVLRNDSLVNHISESEGLAGAICRGFSAINDTILVSTNKGLSVLLYRGRQLKVIQNFTTENGLPTNDIKCATIFRGCYQIGTTHGLFSVPIATSVNEAIPPRLYLSNLKDFAGNVLNSDAFILRSDAANIFADFSAVTFTSPGDVIFRYRLKEEDAWIQTSEPSYSFSNLSPGVYQLEVQARKHNSDWSAPVKIPFNIELPWYKSSLFYMGIVVLISFVLILLIIYVFNQRNLRSKLQLEKLESIARERLRIASDVHDDLGADLSNLLLESRIYSMDGKVPEPERKFYQKLEAVAESTLMKVDEIIWSLDPKVDNLEGFQSHIQKYFENFLKNSNITGSFVSNLDDHEVILSSGQRRQLFLCVKEILHNIQKHANATDVQLSLHYQHQKLTITISDNGGGFRLERDNNEERGYGLDSILRRLDTIEGRLEIDSKPAGSAHRMYITLD